MSDFSRLSINMATTKHLPLAEAVELYAGAGLGNIGLWRDRVAEAGLDNAVRLVKEAGLKVSSLCRGGFMTAADAAGQRDCITENTRAIEEAAALGTRELIMVVGGLPAAAGSNGAGGSGSGGSGSGGSGSRGNGSGNGARRTADGGGNGARYGAARYDDGGQDDGGQGLGVGKDVAAARQRVADRLAELVPIAREHGVRLVLEALHPMYAADRAVLATLEQALDLAAPFEADTVGVVVDTFHVWWDPQLQRQIRRAGAEGRIASYQVCDWNLPIAADALLSRGYMGDGYIDFAQIGQWIAGAGYTGPVEVEIFNQQIWDAPPADVIQTVKDRYREHILPHL